MERCLGLEELQDSNCSPLFSSFLVSSALPNRTLVEGYVVMIISHYGVNLVLLKVSAWVAVSNAVNWNRSSSYYGQWGWIQTRYPGHGCNGRSSHGKQC